MKHRRRRFQGKWGRTLDTTTRKSPANRASTAPDTTLASTMAAPQSARATTSPVNTLEAGAGDARAQSEPISATLSQNAPNSAPTDSSEIPPSMYSRFDDFKLLGRGGMGTVYAARDFRLGREVAIKFLFGAHPDFDGGMLREARAQARVKHENVCEIYEAGVADHTQFIVMQLIHGEPLDKASAWMTLEERVRAVRQVASALHEAHRLGMVHRDVKPSNIMVERAEDGSSRPYIMDFGLAREMGDSGSTISGAIMGTPSFMAPEQAAGKVRSLDRRTDVYCLGATLYDVVVGRPPLVADGLSALLHAIVHEEPLPPRQIDHDVPLDLDAIVMKCLEKKPGARFESAKALGDELQRFLDGEPVLAMKRARLYAFLRRVRRNKGRITIASITLIVASTFVGGWLRARQRAAEEAELSRELGESVKEMELFLRNAHGLPLHDVNRERDIVRKRLSAIESMMLAAGEIGEGPGHYALGRGHLALQEPEEALSHLRQAEARGYRAAGLDYAMGVALSEIYRKELADAKRMDGEQKAKHLAAIEADYKKPALTHLRAALDGSLEAPAYAEGLVSFYEGRHEDALEKAQRAFAAAPWLYEAKELEGDILLEIGKKHGHDADFDFDEMSKWFSKANLAYRVAEETGRSDPSVYLSRCELHTQAMCGAYAHDVAMGPSFDAAKTACEQAIAANPADGAGYLSLAQLHAQYAWRMAVKSTSERDVEAAFEAATLRAEEAASRNEAEPMASYVLGMVSRSRVMYALDRGLPIEPAASKAIAAYDAALELDPNFLWALNESCSTYFLRSVQERMTGVDIRRSFEDGLARCKKAYEIDPSFVYATNSALSHWLTMADYKVSRGRAPSEEVRELEALGARLRQQSPRSSWIPYYEAMTALVEATYQIDAGGDPMPFLRRADAAAKKHEELEPTATVTQKLRGETATARARFLIARGEDPSPWIAEARGAFAKALGVRPWDRDYRSWSADVEVIALGWDLERRNATRERNDAALASVLRLVDPEHEDPRIARAIGEIRELRAAFFLERGDDAATEIAEGLLSVERALALHPRMAAAFACRGRLFLLRARSASDRKDERAFAERAMQALSAAISENPLFERKLERDMAAARRLAGEGQPKRD